MALIDRYINPLTDFGFKRIFGTELNKHLLIDFLNVVLPSPHRVKDLRYLNNEILGNTPLDRKAIFDLYCEGENGERFIVEMQKAKHNFFKDRSVYYATFPIQEQAQKGDWDYCLEPIYTVGILDFIFQDHQEDNTLLHIVELKDQNCRVFYEKLKFIYIELPKFTKTIDQISTHFEKWLYLLKHLPDLDNPPIPLQENVFLQVFEIAELAKFSREEQQTYENSLKYYRDMQGVIHTARLEGVQAGIQSERALNLVKQRSLLLKQLSRKLGDLSPHIVDPIHQLDAADVEELSEHLFDLDTVEALEAWLLTR